MKHINFINTLSPAEQKKIAYWYRTAIVSIISMLIIMAMLHIWQIHRIVQLRSFYTSLAHNTTKYEKTANEYAQTTKEYEQMTQYCKECTVLHNALEQCIQSLSIPESIHACPGMTLTSWTLNAQSFTATIRSFSVAESIACMHTLKKLPIIDTITILSLQTDDTDKQKKITLQVQGVITPSNIVNAK